MRKPQKHTNVLGKRRLNDGSSQRKRGVTAVQVMVVFALLIGMAALAVDVGAMYNTRADLMVAADAASLAGATFYTTDTARMIRLGSYSGYMTVSGEVTSRSQAIAYENRALTVRVALSASDVVPGWLNLASPNDPIDTNGPAGQFNAVAVVARRTHDSANGALQLWFAGIFGKSQANIIATATAVFDDRFAGYKSPGPESPFIPFVIQEDVFENMAVNGPDDYSYDSDLDVTQNFPDGLPEIKLFPYKESGGADGVGSGNFGLVSVNNPNNGTPGLDMQIRNGVTAADLEAETGSSDVPFVDDAGAPVTYQMGGTPGMKTALQAAVESRVGDVIGFFLYSTLTGVGANTTYTITSMRFGRVMAVNLTGNPDDRTIVIQPTVYSGDDILVDGDAVSTNGLVGTLGLVH